MNKFTITMKGEKMIFIPFFYIQISKEQKHNKKQLKNNFCQIIKQVVAIFGCENKTFLIENFVFAMLMKWWELFGNAFSENNFFNFKK